MSAVVGKKPLEAPDNTRCLGRDAYDARAILQLAGLDLSTPCGKMSVRKSRAGRSLSRRGLCFAVEIRLKEAGFQFAFQRLFSFSPAFHGIVGITAFPRQPWLVSWQHQFVGEHCMAQSVVHHAQRRPRWFVQFVWSKAARVEAQSIHLREFFDSSEYRNVVVKIQDDMIKPFSRFACLLHENGDLRSGCACVRPHTFVTHEQKHTRTHTTRVPPTPP